MSKSSERVAAITARVEPVGHYGSENPYWLGVVAIGPVDVYTKRYEFSQDKDESLDDLLRSFASLFSPVVHGAMQR